MSDYKNKTYPLRIDNELRLKIEYIAKIEDRKISQQYERIIKNFIADYESKNGILEVDENGNVHPKTTHQSGKSSTLKSG